MAYTLVTAIVILLTAVLQCQSAPATIRPTLTPLKVPSSISTTAVQSRDPFHLLGKRKAKLTKTKTDNPSCNNTAVKPPSFVIERKLYSERRYLIQMSQNGRVSGVPFTANNPWVVFLLESVGDEGLFRAKGKKSSLYLSMDKRGRCYGRVKPNRESVFKRIRTNHGFTAFQSYKHCSQYISMKRKGHLKSVNKPNHSTHFLLLP